MWGYKRYQTQIVLVLFSLSTLIQSLFFSWLVFAPLNFLYGVWHDYGGIEAGIAKYAPQNYYKEGFELSSRAERLELFAGINKAIHAHGRGLAELRYGPDETPLLREPEIVHLQDVANLIDRLSVVVGVNSVFFVLLLILFYWRRERIPRWPDMLVALSAFVVLSLLVLWLVGFERVFNQFHVWIFPENHQWFFYYQESLMSTMMLAPRLFAYIAGLLAISALLIFSAIFWFLRRYLSVPAKSKP